MTFEEFFNKKRIDLGLMRDAEPALYSEFKSHFELMGEKSFDHTKKFWFNKLRHLYHLAEPAKKAITQEETQIASQAEPLSSPTIEQGSAAIQPPTVQEAKPSAAPKPGFRPRSIPSAAAKAAEAPRTAEPDMPLDKPAAPVSKPGFKPRNVKPVSGKLSDDAQNTASRPGQDIPSGASEGNKANIPKPAYKPRFNAGKVSEHTEKELDEQPKPAYKPRFNVKNVASKESTSDPAQAGENLEVSGENQTTSPDQDRDKKDLAETEETKTDAAKPAYKPRFNVKSVTPKVNEEPQMLIENPNSLDSVSSSEAEVKPVDENLEESPKPAYKPRFNIKNIKPKE